MLKYVPRCVNQASHFLRCYYCSIKKTIQIKYCDVYNYYNYQFPVCIYIYMYIAISAKTLYVT